ncbi:MAG TPA: hypothetical protein VF384_09775 [Planctomycetota bacterium]
MLELPPLQRDVVLMRFLQGLSFGSVRQCKSNVVAGCSAERVTLRP